MANRIAPAEYITYFDSSDLPTIAQDWTLTSPDATVWGPAVSTDGIVTLTSGVSAVIGTVVFLGVNGVVWTPSIANTGVVTVTSGSALSASDVLASLIDSASVTWVFYVDDVNIVHLTTSAVLPSLLRYPALTVSYTPAAGTDVFALHSARPSLTLRRRSS